MAIKSNETSQTVHWNQIFSLAALNAAVVISWIAYHNYQPKVLEKFELTDLAFFMVMAQALILVLIPPIAGKIGDMMIAKNSNHFIVFTIGISITAMTFMAVAFSVSGAPIPLHILKVILPVMITIWLISMNIFHSPANSMLELFAPTKQLPIVMSVITMVTEMLYALEPIVVNLVDLMGPVITFVTGGVLLVSTGYWFRTTTKSVTGIRDIADAEAEKDNYLLVISIGLALGAVMGILQNIFPDILKESFKSYSSLFFGGNHFVSIILAITAILAVPMSKFVEKTGLERSFIIGTIISTISIITVFIIPYLIPSTLACIMLASGLSMMAVSAFPLALKNLSTQNVTFGAGMFFGASEIIDGLINIVQNLG